MIRFLLSLALATLALGHPVEAQETDWRAKLGTLRVGIVAESRPVLTRRRTQPFRKALEQALEVPVEIVTVPDFNTLVEDHTRSRIEYAVYSASAFSAAWLLCKCVEPLAAPAASDGSAGFRSVLFARRSKAQSLAGLRGATVLVPGKDSFAGSIFPRDRMAREGEDFASQGWAVRDFESADAALAAFKSGEGDALFGWMPETAGVATGEEPVGRGTLARLGELASQVEIVWESERIPHGPHAVRSSLPAEARALIQTFLLELAETNLEAYEGVEPQFDGGFRPVSFEDYRPIADALRKSVLFGAADE